jgi:signal transduction histidine kinase
MSREMIDNLFITNSQTNSKGTDGGPSTGLGLIICKEFIEKHGDKNLDRNQFRSRRKRLNFLFFYSSNQCSLINLIFRIELTPFPAVKEINN